ncbi:GMC oxidoreductase [Caenimonas soli]|uniref:GMC oxidoreductase n=1 Tax=Caenimonas soli TaxID=2735555 RepID=UPI00155790E7|nr:GMC family oxidoreductase [Caenimonas soli]NPC57476.1 GMC family oxidoreductase [Caenimonas soli]
MALRALDQTPSQTTELAASVCIIGAGIAGLIAAVRLARNKQRRIIVVESGLKNGDPALSALNEIDNPANNYEGALAGRSRGLGGTSLLWGGKLLPLSSHDTLPRPYLDLDGWPFDVAELALYYQEIESLMRVDGEAHDGEITEQLDPRGFLPRDDVDFFLRWPKRPTPRNHNLAYIFRTEIERLDNLEIWVGATVSGFDFDLSSRIKALTAINHAGKTLRVLANEYLITAGTLESTRLLLIADQQSNHTISRDCNALGRYFNDHLGFNAAILRPRDKTLTNLILSDRYIFSTQRHLHFELRAEAQEKSGIGSAYFDVGAELLDDSALTKAKHVVQGLKRGKLDFTFVDLKAILEDSPSLFSTAQWQWTRKQKYWPPNAVLQIKIWVEQLPRWQNRICLSDHKDALQLPKLNLEWTKTAAEEKSFRTMVEKIRRYWDRHLARVCELEWKPEALNPELRIVDSAGDHFHPAGSTRMGRDPSDSVVDSHLRVHRIPNLSVASASVFPTSGSANPTLTVMCLAMRAADALAKHC